MDIQFDPQARETAALLGLAGPLVGKSVLEIGCGAGRLTWRYAAAAGRVVAIEPSADKIARAIQATPVELRGKVEFQVTDLDQYFRANTQERFDRVILSWSL